MGMSHAIWLAVAGVLRHAAGQTMTAKNYTNADAAAVGDNYVNLAVSRDEEMVPLAAILPLTRQAYHGIPPPGLSGPTFLANYSNQLDIAPFDIAAISCDDTAYPGNIRPLDVFAEAVSRNVTSVLWYSEEADWCDLQEYEGQYGWIYSMKALNDTTKMLDQINSWNGTDERSPSVYATISQPVSEQHATDETGSGDGSDGASGDSGDGDGDGDGRTQRENPYGPAPSTAVAMIILYSITGIITTLFLAIIITGAVRAHRHPERYGPRYVLGRSRQSRARGMARAVLDTIPIVKFGEREEPKPTDVELAEGNVRSEGGDDAPQHTTEGNTTNGASGPDSDHHQVRAEGQQTSTQAGIAAAATDREPEANDPDNQGCSICTDDFEIGQDQRVLPCNHRFHPACIDPWLLNVSGTCPLCRIDLRPQTSRESGEQQFDENGNPIPGEGHNENGDLPPPLGEDGQPQRMSVRRSIMLGLMGAAVRPGLSRDQRARALREYQQEQAEQRRQQQIPADHDAGRDGDGSAGSAGVRAGEHEHETRTRDRLRNAFRIRTRRTEEQRREEEEAEEEQQARSNLRASGPAGAPEGAIDSGTASR